MARTDGGVSADTALLFQLLDIRDELPPGWPRDRLDALSDELIRRRLLADVVPLKPSA